MIVNTFNGINIIALPCDTIPGVAKPSSIDWNPQEKVGETDAAFGFQSQIWDWMQSSWSGQVSFAAMERWSVDAWSSFIMECRGPLNAFMLGDPLAALPKGRPQGTPVVSGAGQTGYSLVTRGWKPSLYRQLMVGDNIQIGYRIYRVLDQVNSDSSGDATLSVWPNLRDQPADGTALVLNNCKGLFRLAKSGASKFSTNIGSYGFSGFEIREAGVA
jgi:hypothetical protein